MEKPWKSGDWLCISCQHHNYASRQTCRECRQPKGIKETKENTHDWICFCNYVNFARNAICRYCKLSREESCQKRLERDTWSCEHCMNRSATYQHWCANQKCGKLQKATTSDYILCMLCKGYVFGSNPREECGMCERTIPDIREEQKDVTNVWEYLQKREDHFEKVYGIKGRKLAPETNQTYLEWVAQHLEKVA